MLEEKNSVFFRTLFQIKLLFATALIDQSVLGHALPQLSLVGPSLAFAAARDLFALQTLEETLQFRLPGLVSCLAQCCRRSSGEIQHATDKASCSLLPFSFTPNFLLHFASLSPFSNR